MNKQEYLDQRNAMIAEAEILVAEAKAEEAESKMEEYTILSNALETLITRVDSEISFSRELIMSAKKIFDARRNTEQVNPINPIDTQYTYNPQISRKENN